MFGPEGIACRGPAQFHAAAQANTASVGSLVWAPFGRPEQGWAIYVPKLQREIKTGCAADTEGFALRLARWQGAHGLQPQGRFDQASFQIIKAGWQESRPFFRQRAAGVCPDPPADADLIALPAEETAGGKPLLMRRDAAEALGRMLAAAWASLPAAAGAPHRLVAFSAYRTPAYDAARCVREGDCDGVGRAICSSHRTGQAVDLVLGSAPGYAIDSTEDPNRLFQSKTRAYRWLVENADRFGFVNYPFEPWHWEWTGQAPDSNR